jgi:O-antigen ligase
LQKILPGRKEGGFSFQNILLGSMIAAMVIICILGFLQLKYFPSFLELGMYLGGWDPHIGRLLSTWFDPNFIGGYLAFMLGPVIALGLYFRRNWNKRKFFIMAAVSFIGLIALYLTYSRSGYLALIVTLGLLALFKSRKLLVAGLLIILLAFGFSPRVQERTLEAWDSGKALLGLDSQKPIGPTAQLRVDSWGYAREIITDHPWIGVGYGRYAYEINERGHGLLSDHASGGSDSSLLTIWATSGIFGLFSYLAIGFVAAITAIRRLWKKADFKSYLDSGLVAGFGGVMIHSIFVNSLLFPLMMVYLLVSLGLLDEH